MTWALIALGFSCIGFVVWYGHRMTKAGEDAAGNKANIKVLTDAQAVADARNDPANLKRVREQSFRD